jgi:hypothetical protein
VYNVTFNNITAMSWRSVLLVEETGVPGKTTHLPQVIPGCLVFAIYIASYTYNNGIQGVDLVVVLSHFA